MADDEDKEIVPSSNEGAAPGSEEAAATAAAASLEEVLTFRVHMNDDRRKARSELVEHRFWTTQPVVQSPTQQAANKVGPIQPDPPRESLKQTPYALPAGYEWHTVDIAEEAQLQEVYALLNAHYVEDDDNMFRFCYTTSFLRWALRPPGWKPVWHVGVRVSGTHKLVAFISATPAALRVHTSSLRLVEINFLCIHKKLRSKRLAPVLIREITRRVNLEGIFQAAYTAGVELPTPVARARYYHRSLNPKKLVECRFSHLGRQMTMQRMLHLYRVPEAVKTPGFRTMTAADVPAVGALLRTYLSKFACAPEFSDEEVRHWLTPQQGVVETFVVQSDAGDITDLASFYVLPSTVVSHPVHKRLEAAYSFYNVSTATPLQQLLLDVLVVAKQRGFDVFNALEIMDNATVLQDLKFGKGDGVLNYYLYNFACPPLLPRQMGLVLL